jgi:hypothetical protein
MGHESRPGALEGKSASRDPAASGAWPAVGQFGIFAKRFIGDRGGDLRLKHHPVRFWR